MMNKVLTVNKLDIDILKWLKPKDITLGEKVSQNENMYYKTL